MKSSLQRHQQQQQHQLNLDHGPASTNAKRYVRSEIGMYKALKTHTYLTAVLVLFKLLSKGSLCSRQVSIQTLTCPVLGHCRYVTSTQPQDFSLDVNQ